MKFLKHDKFDKELKAIRKKQRHVDDGVKSLKKLLEKQFDPLSPIEVIGPSKIHRITDGATWCLWKVEMAIPHSGLRPNQWPRVWFGIKGDTIAFLATAQHSDNYNDNDVEERAKSRITDIF